MKMDEKFITNSKLIKTHAFRVYVHKSDDSSTIKTLASHRVLWINPAANKTFFVYYT